ncbi:uncharacterized protein LOC100832609 isoform X2 [Brachypodium distachyon]|nr:uncharacterized protein LOC100832609 isoform X2 [Brachypodium distachyon]|eukprot:XP_010240573.2 uncharacterized protein LOC100832609 isoform X2 [Brachypodium distachyon]
MPPSSQVCGSYCLLGFGSRLGRPGSGPSSSSVSSETELEVLFSASGSSGLIVGSAVTIQRKKEKKNLLSLSRFDSVSFPPNQNRIPDANPKFPQNAILIPLAAPRSLLPCSTRVLGSSIGMSLARRRCARVSSAAAESSSDASPWASLHEDLIPLIGWRVLETGDLLDYVRLRAVCRQWRSATPSPRGRGVLDARFHPRRWMMLPEGHGLHPGHYKLRGYIRFFNLSTGAIVRRKLPLFSDHCVLDSADGLLLLQRDQDSAIRLLHPFTGDIVDLPPLKTLRTGIAEETVPWQFYRTVGATIFSVAANGVVTVMLGLYEMGRVACATTMDQRWRFSAWTFKRMWRPMAFQGKMYLLECHNFQSDLQILEIDPPRPEDVADAGHFCSPPEPKLIATCPAGKLQMPYRLVECDSEILVVGHNGMLSPHIVVYRLADIIRGTIAPVTNIGGNAIFVEERLLSVSSRVHPTIVPDSVVILHPEEFYLGHYHLASGTWLPTADGCIRGNNGVPSPCSFIYHIFTCCHRATWNKGALLFQGLLQPPWKVKRKWRTGS